MPENLSNQKALMTSSQYWRLRSEILALRDLVSTAYAQALGFRNPDSDDFREVQDKIHEHFKILAAQHYSKILTEIEDVSPRLAADLDDRSNDEVDPL